MLAVPLHADDNAFFPAPGAVNAAPSAGGTRASSQLQTLNATLVACRQKREDTSRRIQVLEGKLKHFSGKKITSDMLEPLLLCHEECKDIANSLQNEKLNHIDLRNSIDRYAAQCVMQQEITLLSHYLEELKDFGRTIANEEAIISKHSKKANEAIKKVPPPKSLVVLDKFKFTMAYVKNKTPFYILSGPVTIEQWNHAASLSAGAIPLRHTKASTRLPCTDITSDEARTFAASISRLTNATISLPLPGQVVLLNLYSKEKYGKLPVAVWLNGRWLKEHRSGSIDTEERFALDRFGMAMSPIWDPGHKLSREMASDECIVGEMAYAHYPALGMLLTMPLQAGTDLQLESFRKKIMDSNDNP